MEAVASELYRIESTLLQDLAEPVDRTFKEKERGVFERRGQGGLGGGADLRGGDVEALRDPDRVGKIFIGAATEFGYDEIHWGQEGYSDARLVNHDRGAIAIPGRHRHHRPAGQTLPKIGWNAVSAQERRQGPDALTEFAIHIERGTGRVAVREHGHAPDQY